jgi:hypothetical protein
MAEEVQLLQEREGERQRGFGLDSKESRKSLKIFKRFWGYSSVLEHLSSMQRK